MKCLRYMFGLGLLLAVMVGCNPHPTSSQLSSVGKGKSYQTLVGIDSLMWEQPDSALKVMMQFAASSEADSLNAFEGHYCQVLVAELLFKNDYAQSNRTEVLKAVGYFDSIDNAFLDARVHYINGAGLYERDSVVAACGEYLKALEVMETHFPGIETQDVGVLRDRHIPRFMGLTYSRLAELFSDQFVLEPAIICFKRAIAFNRMEPTSSLGASKLLRHLGKQYDKLNQLDSAAYYYGEALRLLPDTNNLVYRDLVSQMALLHFNMGEDAESSIGDLKRMVIQAESEQERLNRFFTLGGIYFENRQYDSAIVYLTPVFENKEDATTQRLAAICLYNIYQSMGDLLKSTQYAMYQAENATPKGESSMQASQLNDLFQTYLQEKQDAASLHEKRKAVRTALAVVLPMVVVLAAVVVILMRRRSKKLMAAQAAEAQRQLNEASQQHDVEQRELQTKVEQATQLTREMLLQRVADIYQSNTKDRLQRILEAVDETYPQAVAKLKEEHPELNETERHILLLNFLHFRIKEEADLLGLSENTVAKYRSNLGKTLGKDPISDWI